jgi:hypothetical protein
MATITEHRTFDKLRGLPLGLTDEQGTEAFGEECSSMGQL